MAESQKDIFVVPEGENLTRFIQFSAGDDHIHLTLKPHSALNLCCLEQMELTDKHACEVEIDIEEGAYLNLVTLTTQVGESRSNLHVRLVGKGAKCDLAGAVIGDEGQNTEKHILVEHAIEDCTSDMLYKQVLGGHSVGLIHGKVLVNPGAQKSASEQILANMLTSQYARALSQPMLEIYADDVKCNHGSTIGKLEDAALFYMRQRGIPEQEACLLLQRAFVNDVLQRIPDDNTRERLTQLVERRFRGQITKCSVCGKCL